MTAACDGSVATVDGMVVDVLAVGKTVATARRETRREGGLVAGEDARSVAADVGEAAPTPGTAQIKVF